jgi:hypothetical protein
MDRRKFIQNSSALFALSALHANGIKIPITTARRRVALIGTGWYGKSDLFKLMQVAPIEVVGLCDVDKHQLDGAAKLVSERHWNHEAPKLFSDYRKMLNETKPEIVLVGSPDHWHALQAIDSIKSGTMCICKNPSVLMWPKAKQFLLLPENMTG